MRPTPLTEKIMLLHREAMHKLATPANELALRAAVERLELERAELIEAMQALFTQRSGEKEIHWEEYAKSWEEARALLSRLGGDK